MNLDDILDGTVDNLEDKPEFKVFPTGAHAVSVYFKEEKSKEFTGVIVTFKYQEPAELADPEETPPKPGDETSLRLNLASSDETQRTFAQGTFKEICAAMIEKVGPKSPRALMEDCNGGGAIITTSIRMGKGDKKDQKYMQLNKIEFA